MDRDVVQALLRTIELKDGSTAAHSWRVVLYARLLAAKFGADEGLLQRVTVGAALHDLGKIDVPDSVLLKPGRLSEAEMERMREHTVRGYERMLALGVDDPFMLAIVRSHHENVDGSGYPDGLRGRAIPEVARYFAVIDSFDAMTSHRPYRPDPGPDAPSRAMAELRAGVGRRYCERCVDAFESLYRDGELHWIIEYYGDRASLPSFGAAEDALRARQSPWQSRS